MADDEEVQEYQKLSQQYLDAAEENLESDIVEPAMFNAIHSLELALKAVLLKETGKDYKTHNVGGIFGKHFKDKIGKGKCKRINRILMDYNLPRYPGQPSISKDKVRDDMEFIRGLISKDLDAYI